MAKSRAKVRHHRLDVLKRRKDFLIAKAEQGCNAAVEHWCRQEIAALEWAIGIIEAAVLVDCIDELETVAAIEPDAEAWLERGTTVSEAT